MVNADQIGKEVVREIEKEIIRLGLVFLGDYLDSIGYRIEGKDIVLFSTVPYAPALEFGSYDLGAITTGPSPGWPASTARSLKKKELSAKDRESLPKGMVAFAPFRRVIYNDKLINEIITRNL